MNDAIWLAAARTEFEKIRGLAERAIAQLTDEQFFAVDGAESNSVAIVVKHVAGNQRSRWTEFLTSDGEKPDRHRDAEFELDEADSRDAVMARWAAGWALLFAALDDAARSPDATVTIRGEPHTIADAVLRQLQHYSYHVGQIVDMARRLRGADWKTLSVARGQSAAFNERMRERTGREF